MQCQAEVRATLGEGPVWDAAEQALYLVDIPEKRVIRWSEADGGWERIESAYRLTNGPAFSREGQVMYPSDFAL